MNNTFFANGDAIDITDYPFSLSVGGIKRWYVCFVIKISFLQLSGWIAEHATEMKTE